MSVESYHIIYLSVFIPTGQFYIGVHYQKGNPYRDDKYYGSGIRVQNIIKKYGKKDFIRHTLEVYDNNKEAKENERIIVIESKKNPLCLNLSDGGDGYTSEDNKRIWEDLEPEERLARIKRLQKDRQKFWDNTTPEERSEMQIERMNNLTKEQMEERERKRQETLGEEGRKKARQKQLKTMGKKGRQKATAKAKRTLGEKGRQEICRKIWDTAGRKFTEEQIREIRRLWRERIMNQREIAELFNTRSDYISGIVLKKYYKWVKD